MGPLRYRPLAGTSQPPPHSRRHLPGESHNSTRHRTVLNVGLTGNVAAGKSTVSALFADWGATVIDADGIVRSLQRPGEPLTIQIGEAFGKDAIAADGSLNRSWLRHRILEDPAARETLNALVHPAVQQRRIEEMEEARRRGDTIVVNDIPLLFEVLDPGQFDLIVLVDAGETIRTSRLIERGLDEQQARALMATQLDPETKRSQSDFIIDNDGSKAELRDRASEVWHALKNRATTHPGS